MARIVFYCHDKMENIRSMEYYRQDIESLRALGHEVVVCNRYRDIPWRFEVLFVWWWTYALVPLALARLTGRRTIITGVYNFRFEDSSSGTDYFGRPWFQRFVIGLATKLADANLFVSSREYQDVTAHFGLRTAHYAPCAVGDAYFKINGLAAERTLLLNLAWSGPENLQRKGVWTILDAAALLKQRGRQFELVLAGKRGDGFEALQRRIVELQVSDCVKAIGDVTLEEKLDLFGRTALYVQPSRFEGFGLATAEAMAAGCCVITTEVGEVPTVVGDGGVYVQPGDSQGLADMIERLLSDPNMIAETSTRGAERVQRLFSFAVKKENCDRILRSLGIQNREISNR
jgi:glycosyltransferase involved in cell wall biosynthesis